LAKRLAYLFPGIDKVKIFHVKVLGVEGGGIWISSQAAARILLQVFQIQTAPKEFIFFLPYHEMTLAMVEPTGPHWTKNRLADTLVKEIWRKSHQRKSPPNRSLDGQPSRYE
jgi:hypothetical protein